jgi:hypothetical protein
MQIRGLEISRYAKGLCDINYSKGSERSVRKSCNFARSQAKPYDTDVFPAGAWVLVRMLGANEADETGGSERGNVPARQGLKKLA